MYFDTIGVITLSMLLYIVIPFSL